MEGEKSLFILINSNLQIASKKCIFSRFSLLKTQANRNKSSTFAHIFKPKSGASVPCNYQLHYS